MRNAIPFVARALVVCGALSLAACGQSGSDTSSTSAGGGAGSYSSVGDEGLVFDFKAGGVVTMTAKAMNVSSTGTYTVDGEKLVVTIDGQQHTFLRDGKCIEEARAHLRHAVPGRQGRRGVERLDAEAAGDRRRVGLEERRRRVPHRIQTGQPVHAAGATPPGGKADTARSHVRGRGRSRERAVTSGDAAASCSS